MQQRRKGPALGRAFLFATIKARWSFSAYDGSVFRLAWKAADDRRLADGKAINGVRLFQSLLG
jgi:hypothetical protein